MRKEDLTALGLTEEQIKGVHALNGKDINAEKSITQQVIEEKAQLQAQLDTTNETLKGFEGVNVEDFKKQIEELNTKLETQKSEHEKEAQEREFSEWLESGLKGTNAHSLKALKAELSEGIDGLKSSKNRDEDLKKLLESKKEEIAYLIPNEEPFKNPVQGTGTGVAATAEEKSQSVLRSAMGLAPKEK